MGERQDRVLDTGWLRHRPCWCGQRYFLGEVSNEERIRWQAWRDGEGLKAEPVPQGLLSLELGYRKTGFEVIAVVPLGYRLCCTALGWDTWFKEAESSHINVSL